MQIESFSTAPLQETIPSYLFQEYADDENLQAFVDAYNSIAQGYIDWFNQCPLGLYTSPFINGPLLDWVGEGVYGIKRPILTTTATTRRGGYNANAYNTIFYDGEYYSRTQTASIATDDIYKRVMTWHLYKGDGQQFCLQWLKNRISRFINGVNGSDWPVLNDPPTITVSGAVFTVISYDNVAFRALKECYENGSLQFPFQYTLNCIIDSLINDGGLLYLPYALTYPSSPDGLAPGSIWWNGGVLCVVPGVTPDPSVPPVYFQYLFPAPLLALGGGNLPLSNPGNSGQLWNNGGAISIA